MEDKKLDALKLEIKAKQVAAIKEAVRLTFEKIEELEKDKNTIQNRIKIYKHDLFDLKDGRLDRILERQSLDANARSISVITIAKSINQAINTSPWYEEYVVSIPGLELPEIKDVKINNSITKTHASGTYKLSDGSIRSL